MATKIYYKEVEDEEDPSVKIPVVIDDLFKVKDNLATNANVPEHKETGIKDLKIDLSNLFELAEDKDVPLASDLNPEYTNYYVKGERRSTSRLDLIPFGVKSVSRDKVLIHNFRYYNTYTTPTNISFDVPANYRDRHMFYIVSCVNAPGRGLNESSLSGGFILPGTTRVEGAGNNAGHTTHSGRDLRLYVYFCEVTMDTDISRPVPPSGMVDLSDIFIHKDVNFAYDGPYWWVPYVYIRNATNRDGAHRGSLTVNNVPYGTYGWVGVECVKDDAWHTPRHKKYTKTPASATSVSWSVNETKDWAAMYMGLECYRQEFYG